MAGVAGAAVGVAAATTVLVTVLAAITATVAAFAGGHTVLGAGVAAGAVHTGAVAGATNHDTLRYPAIRRVARGGGLLPRSGKNYKFKDRLVRRGLWLPARKLVCLRHQNHWLLASNVRGRKAIESRK